MKIYKDSFHYKFMSVFFKSLNIKNSCEYYFKVLTSYLLTLLLTLLLPFLTLALINGCYVSKKVLFNSLAPEGFDCACFLLFISIMFVATFSQGQLFVMLADIPVINSLGKFLDSKLSKVADFVNRMITRLKTKICKPVEIVE